MIHLESPTKIRFSCSEQNLASIRHYLTFTDNSVLFEIRKLKNSPWFLNKYSPEEVKDILNEKQRLAKKCLLFKDSNGYWTHSGFKPYLESILGEKATIGFEVEEGFPIPWEKKPEFEPYSYQTEAIEALLNNRHAAVSMATGLGKSLCILLLAKQLGLKTLVMAPTSSIAEQLYNQFVTYFGKKKVGYFGGGKKESRKLITVGLGASLTRVEEGRHLKNFSDVKVFIADECHTTPAATFQKVCLELTKNAVQRFFFSATPTRGDGQERALEGIIGPVVYDRDVKWGIENQYLSKPSFIVIKTTTQAQDSSDPNTCTRRQLYYNPSVNQMAAKIANKYVKQGKKVLILIKEIEQFAKLFPYFTEKPLFAHGPLDEDGKKVVTKEYWDVDNEKIVQEFNFGEANLLVGTASVSMGTDLKATDVLIYLQGGKPEIGVKQAIGRATRVFKDRNKYECKIFDFDVVNSKTCHRHLIERKKIYREIWNDIKEVNLDPEM